MKKKRSEGFFGLHFDFHAGTDDDNIGGNTTSEMISKIIDMTHPDFMQCDCKGHPGYASYASGFDNTAPGLTKDALKIWRKITEENDISLYIHYSGVVDTLAAKQHPDWASLSYDGEINCAFGDKNSLETSLFGDYADKRLIPQLKELYEKYGIDGAWVDGECWGVDADYSEAAIKAYKAETGKDAPKPNENGGIPMEYTDFFRRSFFKYLNHYVDEIHKFCPNMEIASNWAFSVCMPSPVCANVDYLSGDLPPFNSVNGARHEARYLSKQGKPWDLMAWSFNYCMEKTASSTARVHNSKSAAALCQEAAVVLAQGGGFQIYYQQERDGSVKLEKLKSAAQTAAFCRERQPYCHNWKSIPNVAVLLSTDGCYSAESAPFRFYDDVQNEFRGIMECAIDAGLVVDVVSEHHLKENINDYAAIIVPEWEKIGNRDELIKYTENGGGLVVIGKPTALFEEALGVEFKETSDSVPIRIDKDGEFFSIPCTSIRSVQPICSTPLFEVSLGDNFSLSQTAATVRTLGKGKIAGIYFDFGDQYTKHKNPILRSILKDTVYNVTDKIRLKVSGSQNLELTLNEKDGKTAVNLINTSGPHDNMAVAVFDEIPPVGPLKIELKTEKEPTSVTLMPQNIPLDFTYKNGIMETTLKKLEIYDIIIVE